MADQSTSGAASRSTRKAPSPGTPPGSASSSASPQGVMSRRRLLGTAGATGLALGAAGAAVGYAAAPTPAKTVPLTSVGADMAMFHGKHQPGITTALQARGHLIAFDLAAGSQAAGGRRAAAPLVGNGPAADGGRGRRPRGHGCRA